MAFWRGSAWSAEPLLPYILVRKVSVQACTGATGQGGNPQGRTTMKRGEIHNWDALIKAAVVDEAG
jgi:hypothetical protein